MKTEVFKELARRQCEAFREACERKDLDLKLHVLTIMQKTAVLHFEGRALRTNMYDF